MDQRILTQDTYRLEQVDGAVYVGIDRSGRSAVTHHDVRLRRQMENAIRLHLVQHTDKRRQIGKITVVELNSSLDVGKVLARTAPALRPVDFPIGVIVQDHFCQMAADKAGYSGDQSSHRAEGPP